MVEEAVAEVIASTMTATITISEQVLAVAAEQSRSTYPNQNLRVRMMKLLMLHQRAKFSKRRAQNKSRLILR